MMNKKYFKKSIQKQTLASSDDLRAVIRKFALKLLAHILLKVT